MNTRVFAPVSARCCGDDDKGAEKTFSFGDISRLSNKAAQAFLKNGIKKGDTVLLMLKRRYQFWYLIIALHKIGAIAVPSTHLLTEQDLDFRIKQADVKMIVAVDDDNIINHVDLAVAKIRRSCVPPL